MPMVAVLTLHTNASTASWLQVALTLPFVLFTIPIGMLADRWPKRTLMADAEAVRALTLFTVAGLLVVRRLNLTALDVLGFVTVCGTVVFSMTASALVPPLVPAAMLTRANGRVELTRTIASACGSAIDDALIDWANSTAVFAPTAALSTVAAALMAGVAAPTPMTRCAVHPLQDIVEGARLVFQHLLLQPVFVTQYVFTISFFMVLAVFVPYAAHQLGLSAQTIGLTLGIYGAGIVIGALLATHILTRWHFGHVVAAGPMYGLAGGILFVATL